MTQGQSQVNPELAEGFTLDKVEGSKLLSIQQFAQVCRTTPRTLRFYEQKGLFKPIKIDQNNKYRFYDPKQARDFLKIRLLQNFHIPLKQIRQEIASSVRRRSRNDKNSAEGYLQRRLNELQEEIKEKEKEYKFLGKIKKFLFENEIASSSAKRVPRNDKKGIFQTKTFGPFNLFCMKVERGEYARITEYIKTLWKEAEKLKLKCGPSEITFYLNNAYNPKNTPLEIALILRKPTSEESRSLPRHLGGVATRLLRGEPMSRNFYFKSYPKTKVLAYEYHGPYEYLILIYQKLFSYIETQKISLKGLVFETYKYGPLNTKSKYDYQTTIGFPI